jgi:hypothetical protein
VDDIVSTSHGKRAFSVMAMSQAFHAIKLSKESSKLYTFNTIYGRFSCKRLPNGICRAPGIFQTRASEIFANIQGVQVIFDDLIIAADDVAVHSRILRLALESDRKCNVCFSRQKLQLRVGKVCYMTMRYTVSVDSLQADPDKVEAVTETPVPTDRRSLSKFLEMITYLSKFTQNCATLTHNLRQLSELTKSDVVWQWVPEQQADLTKSNRLLAKLR